MGYRSISTALLVCLVFQSTVGFAATGVINDSGSSCNLMEVLGGMARTQLTENLAKEARAVRKKLGPKQEKLIEEIANGVNSLCAGTSCTEVELSSAIAVEVHRVINEARTDGVAEEAASFALWLATGALAIGGNYLIATYAKDYLWLFNGLFLTIVLPRMQNLGHSVNVRLDGMMQNLSWRFRRMPAAAIAKIRGKAMPVSANSGNHSGFAVEVQEIYEAGLEKLDVNKQAGRSILGNAQSRIRENLQTVLQQLVLASRTEAALGELNMLRASLENVSDVELLQRMPVDSINVTPSELLNAVTTTQSYLRLLSSVESIALRKKEYRALAYMILDVTTVYPELSLYRPIFSQQFRYLYSQFRITPANYSEYYNGVLTEIMKMDPEISAAVEQSQLTGKAPKLESTKHTYYKMILTGWLRPL